MKPSKPLVDNFDIILITHGKLGLTIKSIDALYAYTKTPFHLIVVDDSDPDDPDPATSLTPLYFERLQKLKGNITYIHSDEPYKEGNQIFNEGLKHAKYNFVAIVMNSVFVEPDWERVALQFLSEHHKVGMVGLKCLKPWGPIESAGINFQGHIPIDLHSDHPSHRFSSLYECEAVQWALAILRKKAVVGNIPEGIYNGFKGMDDVDNCCILRQKGWKIFYCGYGAGYHETHATRGSSTKEDIKLNRENQEIFFKRWGKWEQYLATGGRASIMPARMWTE